MAKQVKPKGPGGRPTKYDPKYCDMIIEHMSEGASVASFAAEIEVARSSINEWADKFPEFSEALNIAKSKCAAWWERIARNGAQGADVSAALVIFGLKNMAPDDWRDKQEIDHTTKGGAIAPTRIEIVAPDGNTQG